MPPTIRLAARNERAIVEAIVEAAYSPYIRRNGKTPGPMLDDYEKRIAEKSVHLLVDGTNICGLIVLLPEAETLLLDNIAVWPKTQGMGYGRALLEFAEKSALEAGYTSIRLYTQEIMVENIALYRKIGYSETHRAQENGLNRVFMTKALGSGPEFGALNN